jgi:hypothetical protein
MIEEWRQIPGYPPGFEASSLGRIRSRSRTHIGLHSLFPRKHGRLVCQINGRQRYVDRLVCLAFHGKPPTDKHQAAHKNGLVNQNFPENLYWATAAENCADTARHGSLKAEQHPRAKLSINDVNEIRERRRTGESLLSIHEDFSHVCYATISHITNNRNWKPVLTRRETVGME